MGWWRASYGISWPVGRWRALPNVSRHGWLDYQTSSSDFTKPTKLTIVDKCSDGRLLLPIHQNIPTRLVFQKPKHIPVEPSTTTKQYLHYEQLSSHHNPEPVKTQDPLANATPYSRLQWNPTQPHETIKFHGELSSVPSSGSRLIMSQSTCKERIVNNTKPNDPPSSKKMLS